MAEQRKSALEQLRSRVQIDARYEIKVGGAPVPVKLPGNLQMAALASRHEALGYMLSGKAPPPSFAVNQIEDIAMQADLIGLAVALYDAENGMPVQSDLEEAVRFAKHMVPAEREEAFLYVFMESQPEYKALFLAALAADEAGEVKPSGGNRRTRRAAPKAKPKRSPRSGSTASSS